LTVDEKRVHTCAAQQVFSNMFISINVNLNGFRAYRYE
jgi:hypothetical protein